MDRAADPALRPQRAGAAARRRDDPLEARLENQGRNTISGPARFGAARDFEHPIFDSLRPWLRSLPEGDWPSHDTLNALAERIGLKTESGKAVRFALPKVTKTAYEIHVYETGLIQTRPQNRHDLFNALVWLSFPKMKARINAMHAAEIPFEDGRRGRLRDMLTIFDEGGAIVSGGALIESLIRDARWEDLFLRHHRKFRIAVVGHAVLEQALKPYPGITCKVLFADPARELDAQAADWLATKGKTPKDLPALPVFGYPGWFPGNDAPGFYADSRYFRPPPDYGKAGNLVS